MNAYEKKLLMLLMIWPIVYSPQLMSSIWTEIKAGIINKNALKFQIIGDTAEKFSKCLYFPQNGVAIFKDKDYLLETLAYNISKQFSAHALTPDFFIDEYLGVKGIYSEYMDFSVSRDLMVAANYAGLKEFYNQILNKPPCKRSVSMAQIPGELIEKDIVDSDSFWKVLIFNFLIAHGDQHQGNVLIVMRNGKMNAVSIDFGDIMHQWKTISLNSIINKMKIEDSKLKPAIVAFIKEITGVNRALVLELIKNVFAKEDVNYYYAMFLRRLAILEKMSKSAANITLKEFIEQLISNYTYISAEQKELMKKRLRKGVSMKEVAREFEVPFGQVTGL